MNRADTDLWTVENITTKTALSLLRNEFVMFHSTMNTLRAAFVLVSVFLTSVCLAQTNWPSHEVRLMDQNQAKGAVVVTAISLRPATTQLAIAGDDELVRIWDTQQNRFVQVLNGHTELVRSMAYSPDGTVLATAGNDRRIILWNATNGQQIRVLSNQRAAVEKITYSHDGRFLAASGFEEKLRVFDTQTGEVLFEWACPCGDMRGIAFSPDDRLLAAGGRCGTIRLFRTSDGSTVRDIDAHRQRIREVAFSTDGTNIISCAEDRTIRVSSVSGQDNFLLPKLRGKLFSMTMYAPGYIATAGSDNVIRLWDLNRRQEVGQLKGHQGSIGVLDSGNSVLVSGSFDTTIRIWQFPSSVTEQIRSSSNRIGISNFE